MKKILACFLSLIVFVGCSSTSSTKEEKISFKVNDDYTKFTLTIDEFESLLNANLPEALDYYTESEFSDDLTDEYYELYVDDMVSIRAYTDDGNVIDKIEVHGFGEIEGELGERVGGVAGAILSLLDNISDQDSLVDNAFDMFDNCINKTGTEAYGVATQNHCLLSVELIGYLKYCDFSMIIEPTEFENNEDYLASTDYETTYGAYCSAIAEDNEPESSEETTDSQTTEQQPIAYWGEGMYKVGVDIPAGEYNVMAEEGESAYLEVSADSTGDSLITNDVFENNLYITVTDGQYLTLKRCYISLE